MIERCQDCASIWFPTGKLTQLKSYRAGTPAEEALAQAWEKKLRHANRLRIGWHLLKSRVLSGGCAVIFLVVALGTSGLETAIRLGASLLLPLFCIWFCDGIQLFPFTRIFGETKSSPALAIAITGWLLLFCLVYAWFSGYLTNRVVYF